MKFQILDHTGHSTIEFDKTKTADLDTLVQKFNELRSSGHVAATRQAGAADYKVIKSPDDIQDETLFVPQLKGG